MTKRSTPTSPARARLDYQLLESRLIWIQDRQLEKSRKSYAVSVEDIPVWLVRKGKLIVNEGDHPVVAETGQWMFPRQGGGWVHILPKTKLLSLRFRLRWPNGQEVYPRQRTLVVPARTVPELNRAADNLVTQLHGKSVWFADQWKSPSFIDYVALQSHFQQWLAAYGRVMEANGRAQTAADDVDTPAAEARKALMEWSLAKPFSRKILSRQIGISIPVVCRHFTASYGTTPRGFLEQRKLAWARQRLRQSDERIKVIAAELGFLNLSQFSNWFRVRNHLSPRDYRNYTTDKR